MILAHYYSQAGAIDYYGPALGLPKAASSHLSYWYWAPPRMDPTTVVVVGFSLVDGDRLFTDCRQAGTVTNSFGIQNEDYGAPILVCSNPRRPLWRVWVASNPRRFEPPDVAVRDRGDARSPDG